MKSFTIPTPEEKKERHNLLLSQGQRELLIQCACQVYPRVSTPEQRKNVSAEMQQDRRFALLCGWSDDEEIIIVETDDLGLSGQLRMEDRPAFVKMLRNIASGRVKTVIVANISRFFRRKWNDEAEKFMQICDTYGVKVIVPNATRTAIKSIYDFSLSKDIQQFRRECEEAWKYLENHIYGTMLAAQDILGQIGRWGGWNLPPGYIIDRRAEIGGVANPNYRLYIPYPPHAQIIDRLHDRFWELGCNVMALLREISRLEYLFPAFEPWVDKELVTKLALTKVYDEQGTIKGYTIASDHGLRNLLSNVMYIGYWVYKGELLFMDNHKPVVAYNKFALSYNHLSPINLDGSSNDFVDNRRKQYVKKHFADRPALLKGHIQASDPSFRINPSPTPIKLKDHSIRVTTFYTFFKRRQDIESAKYMISCQDADRIFLDHFIQRLQNADEFENFLDAEKAELATQAQMLQDLDIQIDGAKKAKALQKAYLDSGKIKNLELLEHIDEQYTQSQQDLERLERQRERVVNSKTTAQVRRTYKQMMREAGDCWEEIMPPDEIPLMIDAFVDKVVIEPLAPHFYKMHIHWSDPEWGIDELVCYRDANSSTRWSEEEKAIIYEHYETASMEELFKLLPKRNYSTIRCKGQELGIRRRYQRCPSDFPQTYCLEDWEVMQQFGLTEEELRNAESGRLIQWVS